MEVRQCKGLKHSCCVIAHAAQRQEGKGPQVAGNDGYWGRCVIVHPFKNCSRSKPSKGHCRADPRCLLRKFNVSSWLRLGTPNSDLKPGGSWLTQLIRRKVKDLPLCLSLSICPPSKCLKGAADVVVSKLQNIKITRHYPDGRKRWIQPLVPRVNARAWVKLDWGGNGNVLQWVQSNIYFLLAFCSEAYLWRR